MFRAGFVALVGRPNVGKSTLMNALLGQKVAITSPRVQTTRFRIRGVLTLPKKGQMVFFDTPGFSKSLDKLGEFLVTEAQQALEDADLLVMVADGSVMAGKGDEWLANQMKATQKPIVLVLNKVDQAKNSESRENCKASYLALFSEYRKFDFLTVSALTGKRLQELPKVLMKYLPAGEPIYAEDELTDMRVRDIAQEIIREKAMLYTNEELPHSIAVLIQLFDESNPEMIKIEGSIYVDHDSQKGIIIGKQGQMLKKIGQAARKDIETLLETQVFLSLHVKVKPHWRQDAQFLKLLGLSPS